MTMKIDSRYPSMDDLRKRAQERIPKFAFEYLDGGCNEDVSIVRNTADIREVQLQPRYLRNHGTSSIKAKILGMEYDAPFGIAPVGLQGLMWPNSPEILAKAALNHNIPFILSTVTTMDIERASELTEGNAWFQLYNPAEERLRNDIIDRAAAAQCPVLVLLCDVPTFGYRPRDIRNGLALPPKMSLTNILQILGKPTWAMNTLRYGQPTFETLRTYTPKGLNLKQLGEFMDKTFSGRLNEELIKPIRDKWKGKLVLKGVASSQDAQDAIRLGFDGIIVSNHGGRQLDAAESTIKSLPDIAKKYGDQIEVMMDSGLRSGPDIARAMASGAKFTFMGRPFLYGCGALGKKGGDHTISILKTQVKQVLDQLCCEKLEDLPKHLITH
ncbi:MAG: alpha-hydroxy acid oxidase [Wenyingzhuangia sp.]|uniref:alpha-hydroxy acid oxidase n=1 Tax=Wenyingzhuangia sp. TaxID=1964193 RepID=UPI00321B08EF